MIGHARISPRSAWAFAWGAVIGTLGGLIGLGGAEFRLPVLIGFFRFRSLQAVIINLIISLVTVVFSLVFRTGLAHLDVLAPYAPIVLNILAGSLIGSYIGTHLASRIREGALHLVIVACLICLSAVLIGHEYIFQVHAAEMPHAAKVGAGLLAGVVIGLVSGVLGVAGGELIIPTLMLLYGIDIKMAGTLSLAISVPTIGAGLFRYSRSPIMRQVLPDARLMIGMGLGSILGALAGSHLVRYVPGSLLTMFLGIILVISAIRLYATRRDRS